MLILYSKFSLFGYLGWFLPPYWTTQQHSSWCSGPKDYSPSFGIAGKRGCYHWRIPQTLCPILGSGKHPFPLWVQTFHPILTPSPWAPKNLATHNRPWLQTKAWAFVPSKYLAISVFSQH